MRLLVILCVFLCLELQGQVSLEKELAGVYQGRELFIQNPYRANRQGFCIEKVYLNNRLLPLNYNSSAIIVKFENIDLFAPVAVRVISKDSLCNPLFINPDAIHFHTVYKFLSIDLNDSALVWSTEGEKGVGVYTVQKLLNGVIWDDLERIPAQGKFEHADYSYLVSYDVGPNKYRVKYDFANGSYLYSHEVDFDFYPEPVTFSPKNVRDILTFSRVANYEIYDQKSTLVLSGQGSSVNVSALIPGSYVIYFDGDDPGSFEKLD